MRWRRKAALSVVLVAALACSTMSTLTSSERAQWAELSALQRDPDASRRVCLVHHRPLEATTVPGYGGFAVMPPDDYVRARIALFPHSWLYVNTGYCEQTWISPETRYTCRECRRAELEWRLDHAYGLPRELSSRTGEWVQEPYSK